MTSIALVHPMTLLGKEIRERFDQRPDLCQDLRLLAVDETEIGTLTESSGGATFVGRAEAESFRGVDLAILCGHIAADRPALEMLPAGCPAIVASADATAADGTLAVAGFEGDPWLGLERLVAPSATALAVARLLSAPRERGLVEATVTVLLPVADRSQEAIDALFEETRSVLTFSGPGKSGIFPAQIAFNLLPESATATHAEELVAALFAGRPSVAIQAVRCGVFHSLALAAHLVFDREVAPAEAARWLGRTAGLRSARQPGKLGPVAAAGDPALLVGEVRATGRGLAVWAVMDQLAAGADNVLRLAEGMLRGGYAS